ncbi:hypothetical protein [Aquimarina sp. 2201CG14-23]|uniref:hypothetical protein n=1 Tax=Aquimarina mycalae TaxID=3040073 RepID=UPI0024780917|nr:hypothetical protein [Aquimarina sp. 2201CG14-23]MDH7445293.1 hypothetical protein [Aquimarina sp. 2201CG14-23]
MKKEIVTTLKLYVGFILLSVIAYSCCPEQIFQIRSFKSLTLFQLNNPAPQDSATIITDEFVLDAIFSSNDAISANINFNLITSTYATSCDNDTFINRLNEESLIVSLDKDFIYDGNTISANSNLAEITEIADNINFFYDIISINFLNEFLDKSQFENEEYTFTLYIETTDGLQFEKEVLATLNL